MIDLSTFAEEMKKVLDEKFEQYKDSWKTMDLGFLKYKLDDMAKNTYVYKPESNPKRKLIHIANYCYFLYNRLAESE